MVKSVKEYDDEYKQKIFVALEKYSEFCKEQNLSETSMHSLLGISRQSWNNYKTEKTLPSAGVISRMRIVLEILVGAKAEGVLPAPSKRNQGALVNTLLSLK